MTRAIRVLTEAAVALLLLGAVPASAQQDLPIAAFFGTYEGGGVAENADSQYFAVTARDFDVVIGRAADGGFTVAWTTVIRGGGNPAQPNLRHRKATRSFAPVGTKGLFRAADSGDPLAGKPLSWARIKGQTLSIYELQIDQDGTFELTRYDRSVSGTGMVLSFTRSRDGEPVRTVKGRLARIGN